MNRSSEILEYLAREDTPATLILTPNAPPAARTPEGVRTASDDLMSPEDIDDTLATLRTRCRGAGQEIGPIGNAGMFSFGVAEVGRFRVSYATQRGSKIVSVVKIPYQIPEAASLCDDADTVKKLLDLLCAVPPGILGVFGPSAEANSVLTYSLLRDINESQHKVIYILERSLTFLMGHAKSIVVQSELGTDVRALKEGVQNAFLFNPDIM